MKIAFVHNRYIDYRIPLFELLHRDFDVTFFFELEKQDPKTAITSSFCFTPHLPRRPRYRLSPSLVTKLLREDFDIFLAGDIGLPNTYLTCAIAKLKHKPFIVWTEEWHPDWYRDKRKFRWKKKLLQFADACVTSGSKAKQFCQFLRVPEKHIFVAPDVSIPLEIESAEQTKLSIDHFKTNNNLIILYLGRLIKRKGADHLLKAFGKLTSEFKNITLIIAGDGPFSKELKDISIRQNIPNVLFVEKTVTDILKSVLYYICDIFVVPSIYHQSVEPWGLVLNEAMYYGKPVIATDIVGAAFDLITTGINGYIVPEKDSTALYSAMRTLISDQVLREKMGHESRKIIKSSFDWQHMLAGFSDAIEYVSGNK